MFHIKLDEINERMRRDPAEFIASCEQSYTNVIESMAERICENGSDRTILLLNGPSSSGKTTTARRIRDAIERRGVHSHSISMDDYYLSRNEYDVPKDENGKADLESPLCMDLPLLSEHLSALCEGETIEIPKYDFMTHKRLDEREEMRLNRGEIAVIEGIHALNDVIMGAVKQNAIGVYMAIGTEVVISKQQRLAPHVLRFVRRSIRDKNFRDSPIPETIEMWRSVRRGERLYIRPYIPSADFIVNTYLNYEDCVLMNQLRVDAAPYHQEMIDAGLTELVDALALFEPLDDVSLIPEQSIMHEFIG
ncbi:MAG: nucleoside kinase [Eubacteriales bacterium]|nr:nucleoside kinase [Eubacteriales bacterium]